MTRRLRKFTWTVNMNKIYIGTKLGILALYRESLFCRTSFTQFSRSHRYAHSRRTSLSCLVKSRVRLFRLFASLSVSISCGDFGTRFWPWFKLLLIIVKWTLYFTCVSVRQRSVATSNRFGLDKYLFSLNCRSSSSSCCEVKAVLGRLLFDDPPTRPEN